MFLVRFLRIIDCHGNALYIHRLYSKVCYHCIRTFYKHASFLLFQNKSTNAIFCSTSLTERSCSWNKYRVQSFIRICAYIKRLKNGFYFSFEWCLNVVQQLCAIIAVALFVLLQCEIQNDKAWLLPQHCEQKMYCSQKHLHVAIKNEISIISFSPKKLYYGSKYSAPDPEPEFTQNSGGGYISLCFDLICGAAYAWRSWWARWPR